MAIYPAAVRKLIAPGSNDPRITPRVVILHVAVSNDDSLYDFFAHHSGGIESHFYVRDSGVVEQYRDTGWQADANYHANDFAISIETEGMGAGEWTAAQLASIEALLAWCHATHGIPLVPCARWDGTGVGYHSQFPQWSPVAKSCPGPERIAQYHNVLIPWMADDQEEDDMDAHQAEQLDWVYKRLRGITNQRYIGDGEDRRPAHLLDERDGNYLVRQIANAVVDVDALAAAIVAKIPKGQSIDRAVVKAGVLDALRAGTEETS